MKISADQLTQEIALAHSRGWLPFISRAEKRHKLPPGLLLAIASRETNMQDIVGDGGHGRGLFQIDDRFHGDWLAKNGARGAGTTPRVSSARRSNELFSNRLARPPGPSLGFALRVTADQASIRTLGVKA